jgi:hypothetical protein
MENTNKVRYGLDGHIIFLHNEDGKTPIVNPSKCFVDILEPMECEGICSQVKVKVFCPDGNILVGTVAGFLICLKNKDFLFDGRFNSTQTLRYEN